MYFLIFKVYIRINKYLKKKLLLQIFFFFYILFKLHYDIFQYKNTKILLINSIIIFFLIYFDLILIIFQFIYSFQINFIIFIIN